MLTKQPEKPTELESKPATLPALTTSRFFAALIVVISHFAVVIHYPFVFRKLAEAGSIGVTFFFVLSGFILTYNYFEWFEKETSRLKSFFKARFARIFPLHFAALLIVTPITLFEIFTKHPPILEGYSGEPNFIALAFSWVGNLFLIQSYVPTWEFQRAWNPPTWSLAGEVFFYLLFPFYIKYFLSKFVKIRSLIILAGGFFLVYAGIWLAIAFTLKTNTTASDFEWVMDMIIYKLPLLRMFDFLIGCTIGLVFLKISKLEGPKNPFLNSNFNKKASVILFVMFLAILFLIFAPSRLIPDDPIIGRFKLYVMFTPLFGVVIFIMASAKTFVHQILEHPFLVLLGEASYSLYVLHWIVLKLVFDLNFSSSIFQQIVPIIAFVLTIPVSIGFYKALEVPARRFIRNLRFNNNSVLRTNYFERVRQAGSKDGSSGL